MRGLLVAALLAACSSPSSNSCQGKCWQDWCCDPACLDKVVGSPCKTGQSCNYDGNNFGHYNYTLTCGPDGTFQCAADASASACR
jgi:hypothetical protein